MKSYKGGIVGLSVVGLLTVWSGSASAGTGNSSVVGQGPDFVNSAIAPNPIANAVTTVSVGLIGQGNMQITLDVTGVEAPAGTRLGAHIHMNPCGSSAAASGGHYQNPTGGPTLQQQEVWLDFAVNANGTGHAVATRHWQVSDLTNRSLVIHMAETDHDTGVAGGRLACTDIG